MTPDPRTEEIRTWVKGAIRYQLHNMQIDVQSVLYLLGRIEALEDVADKARTLTALYAADDDVTVDDALDAEDDLTAALAALDGGEAE